MARLALDYAVEMAGGRTLHASVDQREWAQMEAQEFADTAIVTRSRFLAWAGLRRQAAYNGTWQRFNEVDCVNVEDVSAGGDDEDQGDEKGLDPGPPDTPAASTSPSPAPRAAPSKKSSRGTRGTSTRTSS